MNRSRSDRNVNLRFTAAERAVLLDERTPLPPDLQHVIGGSSASKPISLTANEAQRLCACLIAQVEQAKDRKRQKTLDAISGKLYSSIHSQTDKKAPRPAKKKTAQPKSTSNRPSLLSSKGATPKQLYQFKITLLGIEPPIWRRIQVRDCSFDKLHEHIQTAMGWTNSHLHLFDIKGKHCGDPELLGEGFEYVDSTRTLLSDLLPKDRKRLAFSYLYDFGDGWEHEVLFEGCPPLDPKAKHPLCLEGERACPPEDCGGVGGYAEFLEALGDEQHEDHEDMLEWIGGKFDSEAFDPAAATKRMKSGLPNWRAM